MPFGAQSGFPIPILWKFPAAIRHILAAEDSEAKQLLGRKLGFEIRMEILAHRFRQQISIILLHDVIDYYFFHIVDKNEIGPLGKFRIILQWLENNSRHNRLRLTPSRSFDIKLRNMA